MTARQICSLYHFDHWPILHTHGGPAEPWNLVPRLIAEHREKTAKVDVPQAAKARRLSAKQEEFRRMLLVKGTERIEVDVPKRRLRRLIPGSRGTPLKKKINGRTERR